MAEDSAERQSIADAAELLGQLLLQDVERKDDGVSARDSVSKDRMLSVHDPELRHGRKSSRFDGASTGTRRRLALLIGVVDTYPLPAGRHQ